MSKARPKAAQRKRDINLPLLPGQRPRQMTKPKAGTRSMKTVRQVVRGASIVRRLFKQAKVK